MDAKVALRLGWLFQKRVVPALLSLLFTALFVMSADGLETPPDPVDISKSIMSPVCPGRLISDCPSPESEQLREVIRRKVIEGKSKQEIVDYFVEVYGPSVLSLPPQKGFYLAAWYLPLALILCGGGIVFLLIRIWSRNVIEESRGEPKKSDYQKYSRILEKELKDYDC